MDAVFLDSSWRDFAKDHVAEERKEVLPQTSFVAINVLLVWLPIVAHIIFPDRTTRYLTGFNGWLRAHGRSIVIVVLIVVGLIMVGNGIYGLTVQ